MPFANSSKQRIDIKSMKQKWRSCSSIREKTDKKEQISRQSKTIHLLLVN
jgi:hypothetical protein